MKNQAEVSEFTPSDKWCQNIEWRIQKGEAVNVRGEIRDLGVSGREFHRLYLKAENALLRASIRKIANLPCADWQSDMDNRYYLEEAVECAGDALLGLAVAGAVVVLPVAERKAS